MQTHYMNRTIHAKLTNKEQYTHAAFTDGFLADQLLAGMRQEMKILHLAAKDMLSPRPEAVARIMELSKLV